MEFYIRRSTTTEHGTFGTLIDEQLIPFAVTLERQWLDNRRGVSCIPAGRYLCLRCSASPDYGYRDSPKFGDTFQVFGVEGRQFILFHTGNIDDDTHGCIIVGEQFETLNGDPAVLSSRKGFDEFRSRTAEIDQFYVTIFDDWRDEFKAAA